MKTLLKVQKSKKTGNNYICIVVGDVVFFLDAVQAMKILNMTPLELQAVRAQDGFIYDINEERRIDS